MKQKHLDISIVIACATDLRLERCLQSIDDEVEVVVVLNGATKEVEDIANRHKVKKVYIEERNLPKALNAGIKAATYTKILLMDSDCIFYPKAIHRICESLNDSFVAKGTVNFERNNLGSNVTAKAREYTNSDTVKAFNPFLGIRKDVAPKVGGYIFDSDIYWTEDADFNVRLRKANIPIKPVPMAMASHPPLSPIQDLRSAFKYGIGKRIRVEKGSAKGVGSYFGKTKDIVIKKGILTGLYFLIWDLVYTSGYYYQIIKDPYQVRSKLIKKSQKD